MLVVVTGLTGVHEMHGQVHPFCNASHAPQLSLSWTLATGTPMIAPPSHAGYLPIKIYIDNREQDTVVHCINNYLKLSRLLNFQGGVDIRD